MLVPHGAEDAQLCKGRFAADDLEDQFVFVGLEAVGLDQLGCDCRFLHLIGIPLDGPDGASLVHGARRGKGRRTVLDPQRQLALQ